jgi:hypothetical protein
MRRSSITNVPAPIEIVRGVDFQTLSPDETVVLLAGYSFIASQ